MIKVVTDLVAATSNAKNLIQFRVVRNGLIVTQICRFDSKMTVIPYLWSVKASESPLLRLEGHDTKMVEIYQNEFDKL